MNIYVKAIKGKMKPWLEEIRGSRKLQLVLAGLPVIIWFLWSSWSDVSSGAAHAKKPLISDQQLQEIKKLPDLSMLNVIVELPAEKRICRNLSLFEEPKPLLVQSRTPMPQTDEQSDYERLLSSQQDQEKNVLPADFVYLGYLGTKSSGRLGAFLCDEDATTIKQGELFKNRWILVKLTDTSAEFQNLKFSDLWHKVDIRESQKDVYDRSQSNNY